MPGGSAKARVKAPLPNLSDALSEANPEWSQKQLTIVHSKLEQIGISSAEELARALKAPGGALNEQLKEAGLKTFSSETLRALRRCLHVKRASAKRKVAARSSSQICWICPICDEPNSQTRLQCNNCGDARPAPQQGAEDRQATTAEESATMAQDPNPQVAAEEDTAGQYKTRSRWICKACDEENNELRQKCNNCGGPRAGLIFGTADEFKEASTRYSSPAESMHNSSPRYCIVGTWNKWSPTELTWDPAQEGYFFHVCLGAEGWESFQILLDGDWQRCIHPDCSDAGPHKAHKLCGPDGMGHEKNWTIGKLDHGFPGARYEIRVVLSTTGAVTLVDWQLLPSEEKTTCTSQAQAAQDEVAGKDPLENIPTLEECLRGLDLDEELDCAEVVQDSVFEDIARSEAKYVVAEAEARGIFLEKLERQERVKVLLMRIEGLEAMTASKLLTEYERRGFAALHVLSRNELLPLVKEAFIWEELSLSALRDVCLQKGLLVEDDQARSELLGWLRDSTWEALGIPVRRFANYAAARRVLEQIRGLETARLQELVAQCSKFCLPFEDKPGVELVAQLKQVFIWNELPTASLRRECQALDMPLESGDVFTQESQERQHLLGQLKLTMWSDRWETRGLPEEHLGDLWSRSSLAQQVMRLQAMGRLSLKAEHRRKGIPFDPLMDEQVLVDRLRNVLVWDQMPIASLWDLCQDHGVYLDVVCMDPVQERNESIEALTMSMLSDTWKANDIPAERLGSLKLANMIMQQVQRFLEMSTLSLKEEYKKFGMPFDGHLGIDDLADRLRNVLIWEHLPLADLREQCGAEGISLPESSQRAAYIGQLVISRWTATWEFHGIPAARLGSVHAIAGILSDMDRWEGMSNEELKEELGKKSLPTELYLEREALAKLLRDLQIWEHLPMDALQQECRNKDLPVSKQSYISSTADARRSMTRALATKSCLLIWESRGIPVSRLRDFQMSYDLARKYEEIEQRSPLELMEWYIGKGFPDEKGLERSELEKLYKNYATWQALPLAELRKECAQENVSIDDLAREELDEEELQQMCAQRLLLRHRINVWEARGFQTKRIGDTQAVLHMMSQYAVFQAMSNAELKKAFKDIGLPQEAGMERADFLKSLSTLLVWEHLPLTELEKECSDRNLPTHVEDSLADDASRRAELKQRLVVDMSVDFCRILFEQKGVPVGRLGSLQAAHVAAEFDSFAAMTIHQLRSRHSQFGMPVIQSLDKNELERRLKLMTLWTALPVSELLRECQLYGVSLKGFAQAADKDKHNHLFDMLMLNLCSATFLQLSVPIKQLQTFAACSKVASEWSSIDSAVEAALKRGYALLGLSSTHLDSNELRQRLKRVAVWKEMPLDDLLAECRNSSADVSVWSSRNEIIHRLAAARWPAKLRWPPNAPPLRRSDELVPFFATLQLAPSASHDDVKKAYKKLALKYHPDKNPGANQERYAKMFRNVVEAYEKLAEHFSSRR